MQTLLELAERRFNRQSESRTIVAAAAGVRFVQDEFEPPLRSLVMKGDLPKAGHDSMPRNQRELPRIAVTSVEGPGDHFRPALPIFDRRYCGKRLLAFALLAPELAAGRSNVHSHVQSP
jgi:hypothetical protein